ncbi:NAD(P)H-hydrate dehydratase [Epidermidibacterium keratini]|uniref:Bifunctional NAD(P)H-hydrate repair enzyme n=1 Tax=Epidermidibacterium keratini TaxID=1891644 RepID=A0A7L4YS96_9ACTN|nr:NAD(P)H-hydrate dehydratase [Epidermidibacterium keratini]QHC01427.1 NAD(P)H-hydrate dehydratase [Epidermidibacterium keratini]
MIGAYSVAQIRDAEAAAMRDVPDGELMQRASYALAMHCLEVLRARRGHVRGSRVVLLVGSGGNGGDALYAGKFLAQRGIAVTALLANPDKTYPGALGAFRAAGGYAEPLRGNRAATARESAAVIETADVVIDGLVGLGSGRVLDLPEPIAAALAGHAGIVAVDVPSGVDVDTGVPAEDAIRARVTVTFGALKHAHVLAPGHCGAVELVDIGLERYLPIPDARILTDIDVASAWPQPAHDGHKYSLGVVAIAAGSDRYPGAAVLCSGGALRAKPGMVRYLGEPHAADRVIAAWPEAVVAASMQDAGRTDAWVVGPGIGTDERGQALVDEALQLDVPVLFDADALTVLSQRDDPLTDRTAPTVLTPHTGEFARLFGEVTDPLTSAREAAAQTGAVVLLKGPSTVIASPDGTAYLNTTGTSKLATAGTGDVLSGIIGALLAAGLDPALAAALGAHAHGAAAGLADGFIVAGDLPSLLRTYLAQTL